HAGEDLRLQGEDIRVLLEAHGGNELARATGGICRAIRLQGEGGHGAWRCGRGGEVQGERATIDDRLTGPVVMNLGDDVRSGGHAVDEPRWQAHERLPRRPAPEQLTRLTDREGDGMHDAAVAGLVFQA